MAVQTTLEALNDPARRRIIELLRTQTMSAGDLAEAVGLAPSRLSYHLNKLKAAGLVSGTRRGTTIYYESNLTVLDDTIVWLKGLQKREDTSGSDDTETAEHQYPTRSSTAAQPPRGTSPSGNPDGRI